MIIVYTPPGGEPEHYDATSLKVSEASIVQRTVDMKWQEILQGLEVDDLDAMRGIVWVLKKRSQPSLRFGEFDPGITDMTTRMDKQEVAAWVENAFAATANDPELTVGQVAEVLMLRLPTVAADPDHARALIEAKAKDPKETAIEDTPEAGTPVPPDGSTNPSPTSSGPELSTSGSSPTSSTSHLPSSTT